MRTEPIHIDGLAGPIVVTAPTFRAPSITVGERSATRTRGNKYLLPAADGQLVDAKLSNGLLDPYPSIEIAGVKHRTGPRMPVLLQIMSALPLVVFIPLLHGGLIGGLVAGIALLTNLKIARGSHSTPVKAVIMLCVLGAATVVLAMIAALLN
ncbi:hypothetical protein [Micromonospora coerulea]|uniref:hypothetical protein n=1 Tax=Micromonospora coerulea TaxID=47856 RepID=UPI0019053EE4|nr:hypothetical protein [Micromonospora veneta]